MDTVQISYFSVFVRRLINAATFCNGALGLKLCLHESDFGFACGEFADARCNDVLIVINAHCSRLVGNWQGPVLTLWTGIVGKVRSTSQLSILFMHDVIGRNVSGRSRRT